MHRAEAGSKAFIVMVEPENTGHDVSAEAAMNTKSSAKLCIVLVDINNSKHLFLRRVGFFADDVAVIWTFLPSNVAGRTKKTVTATVLFISYCIGNAIRAQMFVASDAPKYVRGITACAVLYIVEFCSFGAWRTYCKLCTTIDHRRQH